jgi:hypothetical protein
MPKTCNTLVIAASLIAAIRLAKEEKACSSPNVKSIVASSVNFAWMIYDYATQVHPEMFRD